MIIYKEWKESNKKSMFYLYNFCKGWFLFGIIPLYVKKVESN